MKILVSVPDTLVEEADALIDGKKFRNRSQFISVVLADWIAREKHPGPYATPAGGPRFTQAADGTFTNIHAARNIMRRHLLGDDWDKHQHANALVLEEDESGEVNRQVRVLERRQDEMEARMNKLEGYFRSPTAAMGPKSEESENEPETSTGKETIEPKGSK